MSNEVKLNDGSIHVHNGIMCEVPRVYSFYHSLLLQYQPISDYYNTESYTRVQLRLSIVVVF